MKTYTIQDGQEHGAMRAGLRIRTHVSERAPRLTVGDPRTSFTDVHVSTLQRGLFLKAMDEGALRPGPTGMVEHWLETAGLNGDKLGQEHRVTELSRRRPANTALVHVDVVTAPGGRLWFEATAYTEREERNRVVRDQLPFPSAGIDVVATGTGQDGEPQALLLMKPASSFRVCRSGDLPPELSPVLVVVWTGSMLRCFAPAKFRPGRSIAA